MSAGVRVVLASALGATLLVACSAPKKPLHDDAPVSTRVDAPADLLERATALFAAGRFDEAGAIADALLAADPDDPRTEASLLLAAEAHYQSGDFERALAGFLRLLEDFPTTRAHAILPERLFVIGRAFVEQPKRLLGGFVEDRRVAIDALSRLVVHYREDPRADDAWMLLGEAHAAEGAYDLAAEAYGRLLRTYPTSPLREEAAWRRVRVLRRKWQGPEYDSAPLAAARRALEEYVAEFGEDGAHAGEARDLRAEFLRGERRHAEAVRSFYRGRCESR